ncbi:MAG: Fe-S-containing hydro-lyase [Candidatus Firestonebacteria bacterium]
MKKISLPLNKKDITKLKSGDLVLLSGKIITGRDQAHKRLVEAILKKEKLPVRLKGQTIYYMGPTPAKPGEVIGSCGPTTSSRLDKFTPTLLKHGLMGMIGKGNRSNEVIHSIKKYKCIYFVTMGGAGAYLSKKVKLCKIIAYKDLGPEAMCELVIKDFPAIVWIDSKGKKYDTLEQS